MLFQSEEVAFSKHATDKIAGVIHSIRTLSEVFRLGDIYGIKFSIPSDAKAMVAIIRGPEQVVAVIVNVSHFAFDIEI